MLQIQPVVKQLARSGLRTVLDYAAEVRCKQLRLNTLIDVSACRQADVAAEARSRRHYQVCCCAIVKLHVLNCCWQRAHVRL